MTRVALLLVLLAGCPSPDTGATGHTDADTDTDTDADTDTDVDTDTDTDTDPGSACTDVPNPGSLGPGMCVSEAPCTWGGDGGYEYFGYRLVAGADVDGDGRHDLMVGAPNYDSGFGMGEHLDTGRVVLISGAALDEPGSTGVTTVLVGSDEYTNLGQDLAIAGDVNGDGYVDLILGESGHDGGAQDAGAAWLVLGPLPRGDHRVASVAEASFLGESVSSRVGLFVGEGGDLDGDGLDDLVLSGEQKYVDDDEREQRDVGMAYVVLGRTSGWHAGTTLASADLRLEGEEAGDTAGAALTAEGDLDGDGYADLVVGAPYASSPGAVYVIPGGADIFPKTGSLADAPLRLLGRWSADAFGWEVVTGDVDGDGVDDLAVGAPLADHPWGSAGEVLLYAGSPSFTEGAEPTSVITGSWDDQQVGTGLDCADVDGDGTGDLLVGAAGAYQGLVTKGGRAVLVYGRPAWPAQLTIDEADAVVHGGAVKDFLGHAGALGDLDGDAKADLILPSAYANHGATYDAGLVYLFWGE